MKNKNTMTFNLGHDIAKTRLSNKLTKNGFNIVEIRKAVINHPEISMLIENKAVKVSTIVGQDFVIGAKSELLSKYRKVNGINRKVTVIQQVNNIVKCIIKEFTGSEKYGKTLYWKNLDESKYTYCKRITVGADILSYNWTQETYTQKQFTCKLSDRQKEVKYNNWKR